MRSARPALLRFLGGTCLPALIAACASPRPDIDPRDVVATYSIAAHDPASGELGVAVQSRFFGVGTVVPWAQAGVGAIATQAAANIRYGPEGLRRLAEGASPAEVIEQLTAADDQRDSRQCGVVDARGRSAAYTGTACLPFASHRTGPHFAIQGNILAGPGVLDAMRREFLRARETPHSELADWLTAALQAAEDAGGDRRGRQSAALLVVRDQAGYGGAGDRFIDLRVEDHPDPTRELARLLEIHKDFYASKHRRKPEPGKP